MQERKYGEGGGEEREREKDGEKGGGVHKQESGSSEMAEGETD